jgi:hypothetical protein
VATKMASPTGRIPEWAREIPGDVLTQHDSPARARACSRIRPSDSPAIPVSRGEANLRARLVATARAYVPTGTSGEWNRLEVAGGVALVHPPDR